MNSSTPFPRSLSWVMSAAIVLLGAGMIVLGLPLFHSYRVQRASFLSDQASGQQDVSQKLIRLRLAAVLDPGNAAYRDQLATLYLQSGDPDQAIASLGTSAQERIRKAQLQLAQGQYNEALMSLSSLSTPQAATLRSRAYLEQGSGQQANAAAKGAHTAAERRQLALSLLVSSDTDAARQQAQAVAPDDSAIAAATTSLVALAQTLYQEKLYRSCGHVLDRASTPASTQKYLLQVTCLLALRPQSKAILLQAQAAARRGVDWQPDSIASRQLLLQIDRQLGDTAGAAQQQQRLDQLKSGSI